MTTRVIVEVDNKRETFTADEEDQCWRDSSGERVRTEELYRFIANAEETMGEEDFR